MQASGLTFPWPDPATPQQVFADTAAPELEQVYFKHSQLDIELSQLADRLAAAQAIMLGGTPTSCVRPRPHPPPNPFGRFPFAPRSCRL